MSIRDKAREAREFWRSNPDVQIPPCADDFASALERLLGPEMHTAMWSIVRRYVVGTTEYKDEAVMAIIGAIERIAEGAP